MKKILFFVSSMIVSSVLGMNNTYWKWNNPQGSSPYGNIPQPRKYANKPEYPSACGNGPPNQQTYGFVCPTMMMYSDDMLAAARMDNLTSFLYAVAGSAADDECGKCYQIRLLDAEREWKSNFKPLIVQVVNQGHDVMQGQFDLFMGGGGFGYFTSCNQDCRSRYCQGGPCHGFMYTSSFDDWNHPEYSDPNVCYSGGIKWLNHTNKDEVLRMCRGVVGTSRALKDRVTIDSCYRTNIYLYHQNFVSLDARRVACPVNLYKLTGLRRQDDGSQPRANVRNTLDIRCRGSREQGRYCITTMQDCCKPSCSWSNKGLPDTTYPRADTCDKNGNILNYY